VPAHDDRDFVFARNYHLDIVPVVRPVDADPETVKQIEAGDLCYTGPGVMLPRDDEVMHELRLAGVSNDDAKWRITDWLAERGAGRRVTNYRFRDWLFSRQRYWGEPFPVIHWEDGSVTTLSEDELPLVLPEVEEYKPSESGESPLARAEDWLEVVDENGRRGRRETNTMPQWAGSCWYYLRFIDPHDDERFCDPELERAWMPVDLYVGGAEHAVLHLLYARFWHKVLYDLGHVSTPEPFRRLYNQGMLAAPAYKDARGALVPIDEVTEQDDGTAVRTATGEPVERITAKMSKSLRNVITPDDVIEEYGADTLRLYLMFMGPLDKERFWDPKAISGIHRFLRRSWMLITDNVDEGTRGFADDEPVAVTKAVHRTTKVVAEDLEALSFNTAIAKLMECLNEISGEPLGRRSAETYTLLLAPLAPHLAEELWRRLGHDTTLAHEPWPGYDESLLEESTVDVVIQVNGKKRGQVPAPRDASDEVLRPLVVEEMAGTNFEVTLDDRFIVVRQKNDGTPKLVNVIAKR